MTLQLDLPDDVTASLREHWEDVPRHVLESIAIEGYRNRILSPSQVRRMLGFETRLEVDAFMNERGVEFPYGIEDLRDDMKTHRKLGVLPTK